VSNSNTQVITAIAAAVVLGVAGCGGGGDSNNMMNLSVADAPVDGAEKVVVEFSGVELIPNTGNPVTIISRLPRRSICSTTAVLHLLGCSASQLPPDHMVRFACW
jgi:hypothetical protein